ncbi:hypothetical protein Taro_020053 [Colocasia esculenta]|uniref:Uncharacterized protein n=1 Tax=Colocasia esculenta TaxID=4460 RepID=A0A843V177_COLES|nr:hypothetical protein [Colocasia esculenta]
MPKTLARRIANSRCSSLWSWLISGWPVLLSFPPIGQGGGVSRLKKHLPGGRLAGYHDLQGCKSVHSKVKRLMVDHLNGVWAETVRNKADKEMQERIISGR